MERARRVRNVLLVVIIMALILIAILIATIGRVEACDEVNAILNLWQTLSGEQSFGVVNDFNVIGAEVTGIQSGALNVKTNANRSTAGVSGTIKQSSFFEQGWTATADDGSMAGQKTTLATDQVLKVWGEVIRKDPTLTANQDITGSIAGSFGVKDNQMLMNGETSFAGSQELDISKTGRGNAGAVLSQTGTGILEQGWVTPDAYQTMSIKNSLNMKSWGEVR